MNLLDDKKIKEWIDKYKLLISGSLKGIDYDEIYKWETVQHFQDNWSDDHDANAIASILERSFLRENNNLWSGQNYLPYRMLKKMAALDPDERVSVMFKE